MLRWTNVCELAGERKRRILAVWTLLQELGRLCGEQEEWLSCQEETLRDVEARAGNASSPELGELVSRVEGVLEQVSARSPALQVLEHSYSRLVRESGSFENLCEVTAAMRQSLARWTQLPQQAAQLLEKLREAQQRNAEFVAAHQNAVVALTNMDVKLTQLQHLGSAKETPQERLQNLEVREIHFIGKCKNVIF